MSIYSFVEPVHWHRFLLLNARFLYSMSLIALVLITMPTMLAVTGELLFLLFIVAVCSLFCMNLHSENVSDSDYLKFTETECLAEISYWQNFVNSYARSFAIHVPIKVRLLNTNYHAYECVVVKKGGDYFIVLSKDCLGRPKHQIAATVLHELGHIYNKDLIFGNYWRALLKTLPAALFFLLTVTLGLYGLLLMIPVYAGFCFLDFFTLRQDEYLADLFVVMRTKYEYGAVSLMKSLEFEEGFYLEGFMGFLHSTFLSTHPKFNLRVKALEAQIAYKCD